MLPFENLGYTKEFMARDPDEELGMAEQWILTYQLKIKYKNRLKKRLEQKNSKYEDDIEKLKAIIRLNEINTKSKDDTIKRDRDTIQKLLKEIKELKSNNVVNKLKNERGAGRKEMFTEEQKARVKS